MKLALIIALNPDRSEGRIVHAPEVYSQQRTRFREYVGAGESPVEGFPVLQCWTADGVKMKHKFTPRASIVRPAEAGCETVPVLGDGQVDLSKLKKVQLVTVAKGLSIEVLSADTKEDLIAKIEASQETAPDSTPTPPPDPDEHPLDDPGPRGEEGEDGEPPQI